MSKHSLISTVAGLGLMAASMGASAQLHTFDYSMMYYGPATGGGKYVAFVPTVTRSTTADEGSTNVLMLEMFQPASGTASTWAYAIGGAVDAAAGAGSATGTDVMQTVEWTANNGVAASGSYYFGNNLEIALPFVQAVNISSQACNVTFSANIGTNDQLAFANINAQPVGLANWASATAVVSVLTGTGAVAATLAQTAWNSGASTLSAFAGASVTVSNLDGGNVVGSGAAAMIAGRNKCVAAYTARASSGATVIAPGGSTTLGLVRVW